MFGFLDLPASQTRNPSAERKTANVSLFILQRLSLTFLCFRSLSSLHSAVCRSEAQRAFECPNLPTEHLYTHCRGWRHRMLTVIPITILFFLFFGFFFGIMHMWCQTGITGSLKASLVPPPPASPFFQSRSFKSIHHKESGKLSQSDCLSMQQAPIWSLWDFVEMRFHGLFTLILVSQVGSCGNRPILNECPLNALILQTLFPQDDDRHSR